MYIAFTKIRLLAILSLMVFFAAQQATAQNAFSVSGRVYADYSYIIGSPDKDTEGDNGFGYRRAYLTTDYTISEKFSARLRMEANDGSTNAQGKNAPFVKDVYLKWNNALGEGHTLTAGVSSPPAFLVSEAHWGYRSLEKTILDRTKIVNSRDMGVVLNGPLAGDGKVRYGLMFANNNSVNGENDRNKRVYGQLEFYPGGQFHFSVGGDYAARDDGTSITLNGFAGYSSDAVKVGAEGFYNPRSFDEMDAETTHYGGTLFLRARVSDRNTAVLRVDRVERDILGVTSSETWALAGFSFHLDKKVELIPNVIYSNDSRDDDPLINGRMTLYYKF